uniref:Uncharacterized protein n=1 Tax=viral metagenome TaxID=1070528 RepID=A0A6M3LSH7_9ZZZZ
MTKEKKKEESLLEAIITAVGFIIVTVLIFVSIAMGIGFFLKIILDVAGLNL